jgi:ATP10 protein
MIRCALFLLFAAPLHGQVLPSFNGESLAGKKFMMPGAVHGHPAVLVVCFTHNFGPRCTGWTKRLENEFKSNADLEIYTLIFLEEATKTFRGVAKSGIRSGVAKEDYDHYLIVTEHETEAKAVVHFQEPDDAYLAVLDPEGMVRWTSHGPVSDETVGKIRELVR